jgi:phenylalanyl-tRNA synthetase beta chain
MRLLLSWARDFVDVPASVETVAEALALRGFEVADIERLGAGDGVIDFEVTPNRPDALGVVGLAREIATAYDLPFRPPTPPPLAVGESADVSVQIDDPDLCPRYAAAVMDVADVAPTRSPSFLIDRLQASGVRAISPLVDVTNYVLLELGHPTHAFDLHKLAEQSIRVRQVRTGESIVTLDGVNRKLEPGMLVIADATRPQAVAGVMGGAASEVSASTTRVVFESAYFNPPSVRRTSKRLALKTEASFRFERGADIAAPVRALERAAELMQQIGAGRLAGPVVDRYPKPRQPHTVHLRRGRLTALLGTDIPNSDVVRILRGLGLEASAVDDGWEAVVPTFRVDLGREVDLIEEVGRHHGFNRIEPVFLPVVAPPPPLDPRIARDRLVRQELIACGLSEAVTFGIIEARAASAFVDEADRAAIVTIANPLTAKFDTLRPSLLPGLVDAVAHNRRHGRRDIGLFEIGARFTATQGETRALGIAWTGARTPEHWSNAPRDVDFYDLRGAIEQLAGALGVPVRFEPAAAPFLVPGHAAAIVAGTERVGIAGLVPAQLAEAREAPRKDKIFVAELDLDQLWRLRAERSEHVKALPRFPAVVRDLSIVVSDTLPAEIIRGTIHAAGDSGRVPLVAIGFFDRYTGKGLPDRSLSLSVRLTFQAADRTLTDAEVQESFDAIVAALAREHGARQR